jgi:hypothetical protein
MADAYGINVSLLLHCDGANGSTTFTDTSINAKTVTPIGSAKITTTQSKFGGASANIAQATGDGLQISTSSDFSFGTGDYTVEMWLWSAYNWDSNLYMSGASTGPRLLYNGNLKLYFDNTLRITTTTSLNNSNWHHIAVVRYSGVTKLYIDGTSEGTPWTDSSTITVATGYPKIASPGGFNGYLDEIRVTKGVARYTSNFTASTAAFDDPIPPINRTKTFDTTLTVTPAASQLYIRGGLVLAGATTITVTPYSGKVFVSRNHTLKGDVKVEVLPAAILASTKTRNGEITGSTTITAVAASTLYWYAPNRFKTGDVTLSVTPTTSTWTRAQYQGGNAALVIPSLFAYATGWKEEPNAAALVLPSLIGSGVGGGIASGILPSLRITATGTQELHGTAAAILPTLYATATGQREYNGTAALVVPGFNASSLGAATAGCVLPSFTVTATGTAEFGGKANCILPGLVIAATGQREYNGTAALVLPGLRGGDIGRAALILSGLTVSATGGVSFANSVGYILNVHTNESYQWTNMPFLHIIRIGADYYGIKSDGLYRLSTAYTTDSGTAINAQITTKSTLFGSYHSKRLQYAYIGSDTSTLIQPIVDGVAKQSHASSFNSRKTKMAFGNSGRYWQLRISGIQGELTGLELLPQELQRRVK